MKKKTHKTEEKFFPTIEHWVNKYFYINYFYCNIRVELFNTCTKQKKKFKLPSLSSIKFHVADDKN